MNMTKEEINFVTGLVSKTVGTPATEAASLLFDVKEDGSGELKPTALQTLLDKDAARVQAFKNEATQAHDKGYKKAQGEALTKFEKDLKDKFGITSEKQGLDLIEHVVTEKLKTTGDEKDEEKIKRSSVYLSMVEKLNKEKTDAVKAETDKYNELQTRIQKESTFKSVSDIALDFIKNELKPILPEGKTADGKSKAEIQLQKFVKDLTSEYEFEIKDGKTLISKDGKLLENAHGHMLDFKEVVKAKASEVWDFKTGEDRSGAGNRNDPPGAGNGNKGYSGPVPKSQEEYLQLIEKAPDDATKIQITQAWTGSKK